MIVEGMGALDRFSISDEDEDKSEASETGKVKKVLMIVKQRKMMK